MLEGKKECGYSVRELGMGRFDELGLPSAALEKVRWADILNFTNC